MQSSLSYSPSPCPWDAATLMQHTRVYSPEDENLVMMYGQVATEMIEAHLGRFLLTRPVTWTASRDSHCIGPSLSLMPWPWTTLLQSPVLSLPRPASSITAISIGIWGQDDLALVAGTDFEADCVSQPARIRWISNAYSQTLKDHLSVTFTSGYGDTSQQVPTPILHAILLTTASLFEARGDAAPDLMGNAVQSLLSQHRFYAFA